MCGAGGHDTHQQQDPTGVLAAESPQAPAFTFPEHLFAQLTDAHCHIQDDSENIQKLVQSWSSSSSSLSTGSNAVAPLMAGKVCLMGVQPSKDLGLSRTDVEAEQIEGQGDGSVKMASLSLNASSLPSSSTTVVTVSWDETDTKGDWDFVSKLAKDYPDRFVPCFGIHPWFTHKYKPLERSTGSMIELRGVNNGISTTGARVTTGTAADAATSPSLSFSSSSLTQVPGAGVRREAFLAMSKQLQEQMAKESCEKENARNSNGKDLQDVATSQDQSSNVTQLQHDATAEPIELSTHHQHHPSYVHYKKVLALPNSAPETYLEDLAKRLPGPRALESALQELRRQLEEHPHAVLGEIGLDRTARVPEPSVPAGAADNNKDDDKDKKDQKRTTLALTSIQHQLDIVREQLKLAASLKRAVSFHCVQAYGHWHDFLIQEGKRLKQMEADRGYYQLQLQQIHESGGTATISPVSPSGIRLSKKSTARLKREAREAAWERHVASTLQESSDEEDEDEDEGEDGDEKSASADTKDSNGLTISKTHIDVTDTIASTDASTVAPTHPPFESVLPPRLCMHSYGGSTDMLRAFTKLDHPPEIFFSFSILINGRLQERKLKELILAVPEDRLLIESDHHSHTHVDLLLVEMVQKVAEIRQWTMEETVEKTARNWHRFVYGS
ncbi:hypothetical protein EDD21DRAFT_375521 [Dissophora ornata]|nr:hypothetical protein BGZ58_002512 [Dissophora ornata]KAI8601042.1 hypothetical protein EDD21DRAFT_375521 [Dissophora ornata]